MSDGLFNSLPQNGVVTQSHIDLNHANSQYFPFAASEDEMFKWNSMSDGYVAISCQMSGLPDNSMGKKGWHIVYLGSQKDTLPEDLRAKASDFWNRVHQLMRVREDAEVKQEIAEAEAMIQNAAIRKQELVKKAMATGEKILINQWSEDCNDSGEECNLDIVYEWAMPDGTVKTTRTHTW
jgi:hypothetical protein